MRRLVLNKVGQINFTFGLFPTNYNLSIHLWQRQKGTCQFVDKRWNLKFLHIFTYTDDGIF